MNSLSEKKKAGSFSKTEDLAQFYAALDQLESGIGGKRRLSHCNGRMDWPKRGVYFFFERGELRSLSSNGSRVVRVGTHAIISSSDTILWKRLYQHRGPASTGAGNHRGSVFRKLVGYALMARNPEWIIDTWGVGDSPDSTETTITEKPLERQVSCVIGKMPFLWLEVDDPPGPQSQRKEIEKNAIALLSSYGKNPVDSPSENWLGKHCPSKEVKHSGLWNQEHVKEDYDPGFLSVLEGLVARQVRKGG